MSLKHLTIVVIIIAALALALILLRTPAGEPRWQSLEEVPDELEAVNNALGL